MLLSAGWTQEPGTWLRGCHDLEPRSSPIAASVRPGRPRGSVVLRGRSPEASRKLPAGCRDLSLVAPSAVCQHRQPREDSNSLYRTFKQRQGSLQSTLPSFREHGFRGVHLRAGWQCQRRGGGGSTGAEAAAAGAGGERRFRCYTKTGDRGVSSLFNGERRSKGDPVFHALGDVDELNSAVGLASEYCAQQGLDDLTQQIAVIQSRLLDVGSAVATPVPSSSRAKVERVKFDQEAVNTLEAWLDEMDDQLPPLTCFILPSGGLAATHLHLARSICRRAERAVVELNLAGSAEDASSELNRVSLDAQGGADAQSGGVEGGSHKDTKTVVDGVVVQYLNRLSDYLFTAARFAALKAGREETTYKKSR